MACANNKNPLITMSYERQSNERTVSMHHNENAFIITHLYGAL